MQVDAVLQKLADGHVRPKRQPPLLTIDQLRIVQLLYEPPGSLVDVQIDLLLADSDYHAAALARRTLARLPDADFDVFTLACEDLILHKLLAGRIVDRVDAAALLRANRENLDLAYLVGWADRLGLEAQLAEIWEEAFPGESPPLPS